MPDKTLQGLTDREAGMLYLAVEARRDHWTDMASTPLEEEYHDLLNKLRDQFDPD